MTAPLSLRLRQTQAALRREQMRGRMGCWTYCYARHMSLARQLRRLEDELAQAEALEAYLADGIAAELEVA